MPSTQSEIDVINKALVLLGESQITSRDDNNENARVMDALYDSCRDSLLRECPWNFAVRRVQLASAGTPTFGNYSDLYNAPSDLLYVMYTQNFESYTVENNQLVADPSDGLTNGVLNLLYIARVTDTSKCDSLFVEALSLKLALDACENINESNTKKEYLVRRYEEVLSRAKRYNGQEDTAQALVEDVWITARQ